MPTYEYACLDCGEHVEVYQSFSDEPLTICGVCGGRLRKVFHPAGILFKGSGFYKTDSRASAKSGSGSSKPAPDAKSAESKPASDSKDTSKGSTESSTGGSTEKTAGATTGESKGKSA